MAEWMYYVLGVLFIPLLILVIVVELRVKSIYKKYKNVKAKSNITTKDCARQMLDARGLQSIQILSSGGAAMSDYYDPRDKNVHLSSGSMDSTAISDIAIAAHEVGHAYQDADKEYKPMRLRALFLPYVQFASRASIPLFLFGLLLTIFANISGVGTILLWVSVVLYFASTLFYLITLPIELNASKRAIATIGEKGILTEDELPAAKELLNAAAWTYIAGLITSLYYFFRFLLQVVFITRDN